MTPACKRPADYYLAVPCPFRPVYALGCYCDEFKREFWLSEARELYKTYEQNPDAFVRDACGDGRPVDLPCLAVLTTLVVEIPANRTVDLLKKFVKMIREDYETSTVSHCGCSDSDALAERSNVKKCSWERPLIGIFNTICALRCGSFAGPEDHAIVEYLQSQWKEIACAVRRDLPKLLPAGAHADHMRNSAVRTLYSIGELNTANDQLRDEKTMELYLACWTHMSVPNRGIVNSIIYMFYSHDKVCTGCDIPGDRHDKAVELIGADTLLERFTEWLHSPKVLDNSLLAELECIVSFVLMPDRDNHFFSRSSLAEHVVTALQRQRAIGTRLTYEILDKGFTIARYIGTCACHTVSCITKLLEMGILQLVVDAMFMLFDRVSKTADRDLCHAKFKPRVGYLSFMERVEHIASTVDCEGCGHQRTPEFMEALRAQFESLHIATVRRMFVYKYEGIVVAQCSYQNWQSIAASLGVTEETVRQKWAERGECWSPWCTHRLEKGRKTKRCARCQSVRYCSIECQKRDWKEHKRDCENLKARDSSRSAV